MSFDRLAACYRLMELALAGDKLHRCRIAWLKEVRHANHILLAGEGHGRFLEICARQFPHATIVCVDASRKMLRIAETRWRKAGGAAGRVEFIHAELPTWRPPSAQFDLIVTNFFLDCFPPRELAVVIESLADAARPSARWLLADFNVPNHGWRRWRAQAILALAYAFFRRATALAARQITSPDSFLHQKGFRLARRRLMEFGLLQADLWIL
jgi:ubiquinone/menaquinone biosynthesis C-methylase UbiE